MRRRLGGDEWKNREEAEELHGEILGGEESTMETRRVVESPWEVLLKLVDVELHLCILCPPKLGPMTSSHSLTNFSKRSAF